MIFLFPTEMEAAKFRRVEPDAEVVICGVGMAAAAASMAALVAGHKSIELVVLAGIAGSYDVAKDPVNKVVEVVVEQIEELPERFRERYEIEARFGLPKVRSNSVNRSNFAATESDIENMEGAAVVAICRSLGIPFSEIRAISNGVGDEFEKWSVDSAIDALTTTLSEIYNC